MNDIKIQTLIATMNQKNLNFLEKMNVETDMVIGNQNGKNAKAVLFFENHKITMIDSDEKGLSHNRNLTINNSIADICILADDDVEYSVGYSKLIRNAFETIKEADIIIFNLHETPIERYVIKRPHRVRGLEFLRYGSVRIAIKRKSIINKIEFDTRFGAGENIPIGEDTIFLSDCLKNKLKIYAVPDYILTLPKSDSTWFDGYNEQYFINKGKMYARIFDRTAELIGLQDVVRHRKKYKNCGTMIYVYKLIKCGIKTYRDSLRIRK